MTAPLAPDAPMLLITMLKTAMLRAVVTLMIFSTSVSAKTIHIASDVWCPYICDTQPGYLVEIAQRAFEVQDQQVIFTLMPFNRALKETKSGNIDAILAISKNLAQEHSLLTGNTIVGYFSNDFFVVKNNPWQYTQLANLSKEQIAVIKGYDYGKKLINYLSTHKQVYWAAGEDPLSMNIIRLIKGRHNVIVDNRYVVEYTARQLRLVDQIQYAGSMPNKQKLYVGFNENQHHTLALFDQGVEMLKATGEYQQILDKYQIPADEEQMDLKEKRSKEFLTLF